MSRPPHTQLAYFPPVNHRDSSQMPTLTLRVLFALKTPFSASATAEATRRLHWSDPSMKEWKLEGLEV